LAAASGETKLQPFIVIKGTVTGHISREFSDKAYPVGVVCTTQEKAWFNVDIMRKWITQVWAPYIQGSVSSLLVLDHFSEHENVDITDRLQALGTIVLYVPVGCTSILQPMDVCVNKPFKDYLWVAYSQFRLAHGFQQQAIRPLIAIWVKQAFEKILCAGIICGFHRCGIGL
jgi:hypothetical protein